MSAVITLKQNKDFRRVYGRGKSCTAPALVTYCLKNRAGFCRIGITTSKKLGGAVKRNRCRRVIKEAYRGLADECSGGWDIVFVARFRTLSAKSTDIKKIMLDQLTELGITEGSVQDNTES
ncbi:MAG: ribonuclease P protein component [Clostridiales bacterium]|nr:ribonuclease P protein component [Clostridiales bacterium]